MRRRVCHFHFLIAAGVLAGTAPHACTHASLLVSVNDSREYPDVTTEMLLAGLESNFSRVRSLSCRYVVHSKTTQAGKELADSNSRRATGKPAGKLLTWYERVQWKAKPQEKLFMFEFERRDELGDIFKEKSRVTFDGKRGSTLSETADGQRTASTRQDILGAPNYSTALASLTGLQVNDCNLPLHKVLTSGESLVVEGKRLIEKVECYRLTATGCKGSSGNVYDITAHVDVSAGFAVRELELVQTKGRVGMRTRYVAETLEQYRLEDGDNISFPVQARVEFWLPINKTEPVAINTLRVEELRLNPTLADEEFRLQIPAGTMVHDQDTGSSSIAGDRDDQLVADRADQAVKELQKASEGLRKERADPPTYSYLPSVVAAAVGFMTLALIVLLRRR